MSNTPISLLYNWRPEKGTENQDDNNGYDLWEDILSLEEWEGVSEVIKVLKPLLYDTQLAERRDTSL